MWKDLADAIGAGNRAALLLLYPKSEVMASFRPIQWVIVLFTLLGPFFVVYASWRTSARIVEPILKLDNAADARIDQFVSALRVNPNTVRAVYRRLADAGYVIAAWVITGGVLGGYTVFLARRLRRAGARNAAPAAPARPSRRPAQWFWEPRCAQAVVCFST